MSKSIISAFNKFQKDIVNLDPEQNSSARKSRDWLLNKISEFPNNNSSFPVLYNDIDIAFGSFARKTKTRPLDDIDLMVGISADGCYYSENAWDDISICFPDEYNGRLKNYSDAKNSLHLNSTRVNNVFKSELVNIGQYSSADIKRNGEAVTLKLKTYDWNFDIVPCFFTKPDINGNTYYLIPNRNGGWKKTNPKIDRDRLSSVNQKQSGRVLNVIRILKFWKNEKRINIGSYLLEAMILYYYEGKSDNSCSEYVDLELVSIFSYLASSVINSVSDPKGIQVDINDIDFLERFSLQNKINEFSKLANDARNFEREGEIDKSIKEWKKVFGDSFPDYD